MNPRSCKLIAAVLVVALAASSVGIAAIAIDDDGEAAAEPDIVGKNIFQKAAIWIGDRYYDLHKIWYGLAGETAKPPAGSSDSVKSAFRATAADYTATDFSVLASTAAMLIDNNAQTWSLAQSYISRAAEISAGMYWTSGGAYNPETVLSYGGAYALAANSIHNTDYALHYAVVNMADRMDDWPTVDEAYASILESIVWDSGSTPEATSSAILYFTSIVSATQTANRVYFGDDGEGDYSAPIWALTNDGKLVGDDGSEYSLSVGANDVHPAVGWYTISSGVYAGSFLQSVAVNNTAASVRGGAVIAIDGSSFGYATVNPNETLQVVWDGVSSTSSTLKYRYNFDGTFRETSGEPDSVANLLVKYAAQTSVINGVLANAAQAGQVMWSICAAAKEANIFLSPSSVSPQLANVSIDANQSYALYVSALSQVSDFYNNYGEQLSAAQTKVSEESLQLYCRGTLYNSDGTPIASNVVFTPYVYVRDMTVYADGVTFSTFNQDGIAVVWTSEGACSSLADFRGTSSASQRTVIMPEGCFFMAEEVMLDHELTDSMTLHVKEVTKVSGVQDIALSGVSVPKTLDAGALCMIIVLELAALFAVLGLWTKQVFPFAVAAVLAVLGLVAQDWIADLLLGLFGD